MFPDPYPLNRLDYDSPSPFEDAAVGTHPSHVLREDLATDPMRYAEEARHEIDTAIELARRSVEPPIPESGREIDAAIDFARQSDVPPFSQSTREIEDAIDLAR